MFFVVYRIGRSVPARAVENSLRRRGFDGTLVGFTVSMTVTATTVFAIAIAATIAEFGTVLAAFVTLGGAITLGVGFAAQDPIANLVAGVVVIQDEPFAVVDVRPVESRPISNPTRAGVTIDAVTQEATVFLPSISRDVVDLLQGACRHIPELTSLDMGVPLPDHLFGVVEVTGCHGVSERPDEHLAHPPATAVWCEIVVFRMVDIELTNIESELRSMLELVS